MNTVYENLAYGHYVLIQADMSTVFPAMLESWVQEQKHHR